MRRPPDNPAAGRGKPALSTIMVVIVEPETRSARLTAIVQSPEEIQRITGKTRLAKADIAEITPPARKGRPALPTRTVSVAADNTSPAPAGAQRWRLPTTDPLHGTGIVFGFQDGKATSIPVDAVWVMERVEWLE
jgi:hypothetical protein